MTKTNLVSYETDYSCCDICGMKYMYELPILSSLEKCPLARWARHRMHSRYLLAGICVLSRGASVVSRVRVLYKRDC